MTSNAYREGLKARSYSENPYSKSSQDHEDFHAGFTQKIRRGYTPPPQFDDGDKQYRPSELKGSKLVNNTDLNKPKINSYAEARKK